MRTTLDIDDDVLQAVRDVARHENETTGKVISELARKALGTSLTVRNAGKPLNGFRPFPKRGGVVTNELIDRLRDGDAY